MMMRRREIAVMLKDPPKLCMDRGPTILACLKKKTGIPPSALHDFASQKDVSV